MRNLLSILAKSETGKCLCGILLVVLGPAKLAFSQQNDLAQSYQQQLAEPGLSDSAAVDITVAWLRAITQRTLETPVSERVVYWKQIRKIVASSERIQNSPRGILIRIQFAVSELTRAAFARQAAIAPPRSEKNLEVARSIFRSVVRELQSIDKQSATLLRNTYKKSASAARASGWTKTELESLRRNLALQQARTYRNQALCYPVGSPDYINSLSLALQTVAHLTRSALNEDVVWSARLEQLACLRLLKRFSEARQFLEQWHSTEPNATIASRLQREASELDLAEGDIDSTPHENLDPAMRTAANLFAEGKHQEAIAAYGRVAKQFADEGNTGQQFEAAQTAAAIARATGDRLSASKRFRRLALDQPQHVEASAAHLVATGLAASLLREADTAARPALTQRYVSLLEEHLQHWPQSNEASTVRLWLGRYLMSRQEWSNARKVLSQVDTSSEQALDCASAAADCFLRELQRSETTTPQETVQRNDLVVEARKLLQPMLVDSQGNWPQEWSAVTRSLALKLSEMHLRYTSGGHQYARKLLSTSLAASPTADVAWKLQASTLLAEAQIRGGELQHALKVIQAAQRIDRGLDAEVSFTLDLLEADALSRLGKRDQALTIYRELLATHAENGDLYESYGLLLSQSEEKEDLRSALQTWQRIEKQSKPAGPRWLRARQARLELLERLGEGEQAKKLYKLTKLLYPRVADSLSVELPTQTP